MSKNKIEVQDDLTNDIDLSTFVLSLLKHWKVFLIMILVCASLFSIKAYNGQTKTYYSKSQIYVKRSVTTSNGELIMDSDLSDGITNDIVDILSSDLVISRVITNLDLDTSKDEVKHMVNIKRNPDNQIINIYVNNKDSNQAILLVNEIAKVGVNEIRSMYGDVVETLESANYAQENINGDPMVNEMIKGAILGFIVPFVIVSILYLFNNKFRKVDEVERILDLPVICVVANVKNRGN